MSPAPTSRWLYPALIALFVLQWTAPFSIGYQRSTTLRDGVAYRFRVMPIDPADPFLGRYVVLNLEQARRPRPPPSVNQWQTGDRAYLPVTTGTDGYAQLGALLPTPPSSGDWIEASLQYVGESEVTLALPFDRYYLNEQLAPAAERAYREATARRSDTTEPQTPQSYVLVRVRKGLGVIEDLYLDGKPIHDTLTSEPKPTR